MVEHYLAKVNVASSNLVSRSTLFQRKVKMNFDNWKQAFSHKHVNDEMHKLLDELKALEEKAVEELTEAMALRLKELKEFAENVEKMLVAEWKWFIEKIEGRGNDYND